MKKFAIYGLLLSSLLLSCGKDDDQPIDNGTNTTQTDETSAGDSTSTDAIPETYDTEEGKEYREMLAEEEPMDRLVRILQKLNGTQESQSNASSSRTGSQLRIADTIPDYSNMDMCELMIMSFEQRPSTNSGSCYTESHECVDGGKYKRTADYHDGCDAGDQKLFGKMIYIIDELVISGSTNATFEFIDYGTVGEPSIMNATGKQEINNLGFSAQNVVTDADYVITEPGETITLKLHAETSTINGETTMLATYDVSSDYGYSLSVTTPVEITYSTACSYNNETQSTMSPITGKHEMILLEDDQADTYMVDYGTGDCDFMHTITDANGNSRTFHDITGEEIVQ